MQKWGEKSRNGHFGVKMPFFGLLRFLVRTVNHTVMMVPKLRDDGLTPSFTASTVRRYFDGLYHHTVIAQPCWGLTSCHHFSAVYCMIDMLMPRVGQNHIFTVYLRYFWYGNHQTYSHLWCIYTVLANPTYAVYSMANMLMLILSSFLLCATFSVPCIAWSHCRVLVSLLLEQVRLGPRPLPATVTVSLFVCLFTVCLFVVYLCPCYWSRCDWVPGLCHVGCRLWRVAWELSLQCPPSAPRYVCVYMCVCVCECVCVCVNVCAGVIVSVLVSVSRTLTATQTL